MQRRKLTSDAELAEAIGVTVNDPIAERAGRVHTRESIAKFEEARVPWLRRRKWRRPRSKDSS